MKSRSKAFERAERNFLIHLSLAVAALLLPTGLTAAQETGEPKSMETACKQEVVDLHRFFQEWFRGELPKTDAAFERFAGVMNGSFHIVSPAGRKTAIEPLKKGLHGAHGSWSSASVESPGSKIWIENMHFQKLSDDLGFVTYEEWQIKDGPAKGRLSTAIFERDSQAPNGVRWLHVHETWLPDEDSENPGNR